jgi:hypothetical protein
MRDIFYEELRRNSAEAMQLTAEQMDKVINAVKNVLRFHALARKEGLLWLDTELGHLIWKQKINISLNCLCL